MLCTRAEYNQPFASNTKPQLANKETNYLNLLHLFVILVMTLLQLILVTPPSSYCVTKIKLFHNLERLAI